MKYDLFDSTSCILYSIIEFLSFFWEKKYCLFFKFGFSIFQQFFFIFLSFQNIRLIWRLQYIEITEYNFCKHPLCVWCKTFVIHWQNNFLSVGQKYINYMNIDCNMNVADIKWLQSKSKCWNSSWKLNQIQQQQQQKTCYISIATRLLNKK